MDTNKEKSEGLQIEGLVCFQPDLTRFEYLCRQHFLHVLQRLESLSAWNRVPTPVDFYNYCLRCLRAYAHMSLGPRYAAHGFRTDSIGKIKTTIGSVVLPTYIYGMIREICRPMYSDTSVEICAYMRLDQAQGVGLVPGIGWTSTDRFFSSLFARNAELQTSVLEEESPASAPIFVSTDTNFAFANGSTPPVYRLEAMNALRHLRPHSVFYLGYRNITLAPGLDVAPVITNVNTVAFTGFPEPAPVQVNVHNFDPGTPLAAQIEFYDANGVNFGLSTFCGYHQITIDMVDTVQMMDAQGNVLDVRRVPVPPPAQFSYGVLGPQVVHSIIRALNPVDPEYTDRVSIRGRLCLGNAFAYAIYPYHNTFDSAFPSSAHPSVPRNAAERPLVGRRPKRKKSNPGSKKPVAAKPDESSTPAVSDADGN